MVGSFVHACVQKPSVWPGGTAQIGAGHPHSECFVHVLPNSPVSAASAVHTAGVFAPSAAASLGGASDGFGKHMPSLNRWSGSHVAVFAQPAARSADARSTL